MVEDVASLVTDAAPDEIERLRAAMPAQRDRTLLGLLAYAGLRPEEALALRWVDVGRLLIIDRAFNHGEEKGTKTNQRRTVEIIKPLAADLEALRAASGGEGLVAPSEAATFTSATGATGSGPGLRTRRRRGDAVRLPALASLLIHAGRSPLAVAAALGHASGETTWQHYAHVFEEAQLRPRRRSRRRSSPHACESRARTGCTKVARCRL